MRLVAHIKLDKRGDTIVEVLIALAIVSLVLVSSYALVRRNVAAGQEVQEQTTALKLVERQAEFLLAADSVPTTAGCFNEDGIYVTAPSSSCDVDSDATEFDPVVDGGAKYTVSITQDSSSKLFTISAVWQTLRGENAIVSSYVRRAD